MGNEDFGGGPDAGLDDLLRTLAEGRHRDREAGAARGEAPAEGDAEDRRDLELLGLLAHELEERPPAPEVKERLMASVRAGAAGEPSAAGSVAPVASLAAVREGREPAADRSDAGPRAAGRLPSGLALLVAALLLAVVGLAAFSGRLYLRLDDQQATIAALSRQLEAASDEAQQLARAQGDLERNRLHLASRLALVATPGTEVCPLHPRGEEPLYPDARGLLFLSGPRDQWYVRLANVEPAPEGRAYRLWFVLGDDFRPAGILHPGIDGAVELAGSRLPAPGRMTAVLVTLEPASRTPAHPSGPTVLYGDEKMEMI